MFKNRYGEEFNVGERVWAFTTCGKTSYVYAAEFYGVNSKGYVRVVVDDHKTVYVNTVTSKHGWDYQASLKKQLKMDVIEFKRVSTLKLNRIFERV